MRELTAATMRQVLRGVAPTAPIKLLDPKTGKVTTLQFANATFGGAVLLQEARKP